MNLNSYKSFHSLTRKVSWQVFMLLSVFVFFTAGAVMGQESGFAQWPELQKGHAPDSAFQVDGIDSVNLLNGNLTLTIPIGAQYPVSNNLSYGLSLVYNSNPWEVLKANKHKCDAPIQTSSGENFESVSFDMRTLDKLSNAGVGWMLNIGRFEPPNWLYEDVTRPPFTYVAPDGSRHGLHPELHHLGPEETNVYYSRNGSFMRMFLGANCDNPPPGGGTCRRVEFPDGSYHEFHEVGLEGGDYRPTLMSDAFGHRVLIDYGDFSWTITDDHQRSHVVSFDTATAAKSYSKILSISTTAFGGQTAAYSFEYGAPVDIERHRSSIIQELQCATASVEPFSLGNPLLGATVESVDFLEKLILPDGSFFEMSYGLDDGSIGKSGAIQHLRLPSGLHYRWRHEGIYGGVGPNVKLLRPAELVVGVSSKQRYILAADGTEQNVVTWQYDAELPPLRGDAEPNDGGAGASSRLSCFQTTDVKFYAGDLDSDSTLEPLRHSRHYFSKALFGPSGALDFNSRQSLPFAPCAPDGDGDYFNDPSSPWYYEGLFLSEEILDPANPDGSALRSVWVDYETDAPITWDEKDGDRRLIRRRTVFHDDGDRWTEIRYADFDGLGNFRKKVQSSNFEGTPVAKTTFMGYNSEADGGLPSGPYFTPSSSSPWVLGLYDESCVHQGSGFSSCDNAQQRTLFDFDESTGYLRATRQLRGATSGASDILTLYIDADADNNNVEDGNVSSEKLYGGDGDDDGLGGGSGFSPGSTSPVHHVDHSYSFGALSKSVVMDGSEELLVVLDQTIDRDTGLPSATRDAAGLQTNLEFDTMGRLIQSSSDISENIASQFFRYTVADDPDEPDLTIFPIKQFCETAPNCPLTPLGMALEVRTCPPGTTSYDACHDLQLGEKRYFYDRQGRLVDERRLIPWAGHVNEVYRQTAYDLSDRKLWETEWHVEDLELDVWFTGYNAYDLFDRPLTVTRPDGVITAFTYSGERSVSRTVTVHTTDGDAPSTTTEHRDGFGRLVRVTEPSGFGGTDVETTYLYDHGDRLVQVCVGDDDNPLNGCGGGGQKRSFTYDGAGLMTEEEHPEIDDPVSFTYDARGNVLSKTFLDSAVHSLSYTYDAAGRAIEVSDGNDAPFLEYFYGLNNVEGRRKGKLYQARRHNRVPASADPSQLIDHVVTETFDYSASGDRLAFYTVRSNRGASFRTGYTYDAVGSLTGLDYPECDRAPCQNLDSGPDLVITNTVGMPIKINGWVDNVTYRARGSIKGIVHSNGITDDIERDLHVWRPIGRVLIRGGGETLWNSGYYEYDGAGNIYQIGDQERFTYDLMNRLTSAQVSIPTGTLTETQSYDRYGNIWSSNRLGVTRELNPDSSTNRLSDTLATYDVGGNVTSWTEGGQTYTYTYAPDNRITTLEGNGKERAFLYTATGERFAVLDRITGDDEYMTRDPGNGLLSRFERSPSGQWQRKKDYIRLDSKAIATQAGGIIRHLHHDHLGSTRLITDATGAVVGDLTTYFPFGSYAHDGAPGAEEHRFTGHERDDVGQDSATIDYMHARYYAPSVGRFLSVDPVLGTVGSPQSWNRYSYVYNNPLQNTDPDGRVVVGLLKKGFKVAAKGGDAALAFAGVIEDYNTLTDSNASGLERTIAGLSLASELFSPISARDAKAIGNAASNLGAADSLSGAASKPREIISGIYEFVAASGDKYVGQSKDIERRLREHRRGPNPKLREGEEVTITPVDGNKTKREIAEQRRIDQLEGIDNLENKRNPIGPKRRHLLDDDDGI